MNFFDLKVNIIPTIDPQCTGIVDSLSILKGFKEHNISKICASPFIFDIHGQNPKNILIEMQKEASKISNYDIPDIIYTTEYPINYNYSNPSALNTINKTKYLMLKFPKFDFPKNLNILLKRFNNQGFTIILNNLESNILFTKYFDMNILTENNCLINLNISNILLDNKSKQISFIKLLFEKKLIAVVSGFSSLISYGIIESVNKFSYLTNIDKDKILNDYMWRNPNVISSSDKWENK